MSFPIHIAGLEDSQLSNEALDFKSKAFIKLDITLQFPSQVQYFCLNFNEMNSTTLVE